MWLGQCLRQAAPGTGNNGWVGTLKRCVCTWTRFWGVITDRQLLKYEKKGVRWNCSARTLSPVVEGEVCVAVLDMEKPVWIAETSVCHITRVEWPPKYQPGVLQCGFLVIQILKTPDSQFRTCASFAFSGLRLVIMLKSSQRGKINCENGQVG